MNFTLDALQFFWNSVGIGLAIAVVLWACWRLTR